MIETISNLEEIENLYKDGLNAPYRKVEDGHGYYGVMIRDKSSGKVQCHICGGFYESITPHAANKHKFVSGEYKEKYGFPKSFPLCSQLVSENRRKGRLKAINSPNGLKISFKSGNKHRAKRYRSAYTYLAYQNKNNICPEQITRRYLVVCDEFGKQASFRDILNIDPALHAVIRRRYGTFNKFKLQNNIGGIVKKPPVMDKDRIVWLLRKYARETKSIPRSNNFRVARNGYPTNATVLNHFGSWNRALAFAGFSVNEAA